MRDARNHAPLNRRRTAASLLRVHDGREILALALPTILLTARGDDL